MEVPRTVDKQTILPVKSRWWCTKCKDFVEYTSDYVCAKCKSRLVWK